MNKYIFMGAPGSGKGTQAKLLRETYDLVHISVGDILRWNVQSHTKLGARIKRILTLGQLVPDELVDEVVRIRLDQHDWNFGFILDGFPRNRSQAEFFLESYNIDAVIVLDVPDEVVTQRILARRVCSGCGREYNLISYRPHVPDVCNLCKSPLIQRADDHPEAIRERLRDYHEKTLPAVDLFGDKKLVIPVNGVEPAAEVQRAIRKRIGVD